MDRCDAMENLVTCVSLSNLARRMTKPYMLPANVIDQFRVQPIDGAVKPLGHRGQIRSDCRKQGRVHVSVIEHQFRIAVEKWLSRHTSLADRKTRSLQKIARTAAKTTRRPRRMI